MEKNMRQAIDRGLSKHTHDKATVKCFPTYVRQLPSGNETGKFLALDLGGTNFRVVVIDIGKDRCVNLSIKNDFIVYLYITNYSYPF